MARNPAQDRRLTTHEIQLLKIRGVNPEELKVFSARLDLFKDQAGWVYIKPKDGGGPGEPTGINLKQLQ